MVNNDASVLGLGVVISGEETAAVAANEELPLVESLKVL